MKPSTSVQKPRWRVIFRFKPDGKGRTYELSKAKLTVRAHTRKRAEKLGTDWLDGKWKHYDLTVEPV